MTSSNDATAAARRAKKARRYTFEYSTLALIAGSVCALVAFAISAPPSASTIAPRADLGVAAPNMVVSAGMPVIHSLEALKRHAVKAVPLGDLPHLSYDLDAVLKGTEVPRVFLASFPTDLSTVSEVQTRKTLFFKTVLPLVLKANERLRADRRRLWDMHFQRAMGLRLNAADRLWLEGMAERYKTRPNDIEALLVHVDVIPTSLALAQAAEESGWGTSRFAREGNALFGQWTFDETKGLIPEEREDGQRHAVKKFTSLADAVQAYMHNLNTHRAYRDLRKYRAALRKKAVEPTGEHLVGTLHRYSQRGEEYIDSLRTIMDANNLNALDDARLNGEKR
ncbi:MAG: glucosaminidase domain-containing protein, partial [Rhodospirillales bacterium]|nr:glucosaminidase domain-containing protein [Rhodospirillales bacterium]